MRDNILSASVPISLDGREYELRYHAFAFIRYAEECGGDLLADLRSLGEGLRGLQGGEEAEAPPVALAPLLSKVRDVLWAGLIEAHPDLTREAAARLFGFADLGALSAAIMQALTRTLPDAPKQSARPTKAPGRRDSRPIDGLASGPSSAIAQASAPANSSP